MFDSNTSTIWKQLNRNLWGMATQSDMKTYNNKAKDLHTRVEFTSEDDYKKIHEKAGETMLHWLADPTKVSATSERAAGQDARYRTILFGKTNIGGNRGINGKIINFPMGCADKLKKVSTSNWNLFKGDKKRYWQVEQHTEFSNAAVLKYYKDQAYKERAGNPIKLWVVKGYCSDKDSKHKTANDCKKYDCEKWIRSGRGTVILTKGYCSDKRSKHKTANDCRKSDCKKWIRFKKHEVCMTTPDGTEIMLRFAGYDYEAWLNGPNGFRRASKIYDTFDLVEN